ncbi:hypothetical protein CAPTEDRAFT_35450, partial [Capitella teleta]|uniref:G-protein coupled receptors family 1 profile domain-containing protein n=1 Tax=Capitella teleta TaxID=283909 RepID=X2B345_CAPTE
KFVINTVCAGCLCILGILGNSLSCLVLRKDKDTPVASFLLQALALTDTFFLCTWLAHFSLDDLFNYLHVSREFRYHWWLVRLFTYPLLFIGQTATIWMTVLIAVSRFIAVCKPYKAVQYCTLISIRKAVICVITASLVYNLPRFFENKLVTDTKNGTVKGPYTRTEFADTRAYNTVYFDIMYYIFIFVMPLMLLATLNMKLTIAYRSIQQRRNSMRGIGRREFMDNNITLVMIIVVLVFMLCNAPARLVQIIWNYRRHRCLSANFFLQEISIVLEVFNSSANFIIYCAFRKQFRLILQSSFC